MLPSHRHTRSALRARGAARGPRLGGAGRASDAQALLPLPRYRALAAARRAAIHEAVHACAAGRRRRAGRGASAAREQRTATAARADRACRPLPAAPALTWRAPAPQMPQPEPGLWTTQRGAATAAAAAALASAAPAAAPPATDAGAMRAALRPVEDALEQQARARCCSGCIARIVARLLRFPLDAFSRLRRCVWLTARVAPTQRLQLEHSASRWDASRAAMSAQARPARAAAPLFHAFALSAPRGAFFSLLRRVAARAAARMHPRIARGAAVLCLAFLRS